MIISCHNYKYLGIIFDKHLNWEPHIEHLCKKLLRACGALIKIRNCVSIQTMREIYDALIHFYLRYGIIVWGNISKNVAKPLISLINWAIRIMSFAPFWRVDLKTVHQNLKILEIDQIFEHESAKFMYKKKNCLIPTKVGEYFQQRAQPTHNYNLRSRPDAPHRKIIYRSTIGETSMLIRGEKL